MGFWYGLLAFIVIFVGYAYLHFRRMKRFSNVPTSKNVVELSSGNFNKSIAKGVVLVDFWADWCMPCKVMTSVINELSDEMGNKATIAKLDVEKFQKTAQQYNIRSIPTFILFKDGKEVERFQGVKRKGLLTKKIEGLL